MIILRNLKKKTVGITAPRSFLAKQFVKKNKNIFRIKVYRSDINDKKKFNNWINRNSNINYFINFASYSKKNNKDKNVKTNFKSVINLLNIINKSRLKNFKYFLSLSTCHVFKKSLNILNEKSAKKPDNFYGISKLKMEKKILKDYKKYYFKIGICRIFNFYNYINKNYFLNDVIKKLKSKKKKIKFIGVDTYRDFIHHNDIVSAINHMLNHNLEKDFNVSSGKKLYLKKVIVYLNNKIKKKELEFIDTNKKNLVGSSKKLKRTGWKINRIFDYKKIIF